MKENVTKTDTTHLFLNNKKVAFDIYLKKLNFIFISSCVELIKKYYLIILHLILFSIYLTLIDKTNEILIRQIILSFIKGTQT
jgi:hypothetical protein